MTAQQPGQFRDDLLDLFPASFDASVYRESNSDLSAFTEEHLSLHYASHGESEGRVCSPVDSRDSFFSRIPRGAKVLEIGPFNNPAIRTHTAHYFDTMDTDQLRRRAIELGLDTSGIPRIDWVDERGDLAVVGERYDFCVSSHVIEHQPDLVRHLNQVESLLTPRGLYLLAVPDRRYTFDRHLAESTIADILDAHRSQQTRHSLRSVIEHRALVTHNDPQRHWLGTEDLNYRVDHLAVVAAIDEFFSNDGYIDVHAWHFTPAGFSSTMKLLRLTNATRLEVRRLYPTLRNSNEFYVVMQKSAVI